VDHPVNQALAAGRVGLLDDDIARVFAVGKIKLFAARFVRIGVYRHQDKTPVPLAVIKPGYEADR
jgi:hypothetical protein